MYNFEALSDDDRKQMLEVIGVKSVEDIYEVIPKDARMIELDLPDGADEIAAMKNMKKMADMNNVDYLCFLGGGAKKRYIPPVIADITSRFEFLSCYTPYQAEISQGSLRAMYEFQSLICNLVNQDVSNASVYDGASACAEAILMASRLTKKRKAFVSSDINPNYLEVIKTYLWANEIELIIGEDSESCDLCAKLYQTPNRNGEFKEKLEKNSNELIIACVDIMSCVLFEPPKVDITVGDIQSFGIGLHFGGAFAGFIACNDQYKRQLPGRISGKTLDKNGKTAYCLTLQAREQHIRRDKATSNICSNQALVAFSANIYARKLGAKGLLQVARQSYCNAHNLANKMSELGFEIENENFFDEFVVNVACADKFIEFMKSKNILAGTKIDEKRILVGVSELNDDIEIDEYIKAAQKLSLIRIAR